MIIDILTLRNQCVTFGGILLFVYVQYSVYITVS